MYTWGMIRVYFLLFNYCEWRKTMWANITFLHFLIQITTTMSSSSMMVIWVNIVFEYAINMFHCLLTYYYFVTSQAIYTKECEMCVYCFLVSVSVSVFVVLSACVCNCDSRVVVSRVTQSYSWWRRAHSHRASWGTRKSPCSRRARWSSCRRDRRGPPWGAEVPTTWRPRGERDAVCKQSTDRPSRPLCVCARREKLSQFS